jgi:short-subunit dehydrogenase
MDLKLTGKRALITGGSKGIGQASAAMLADEGCDVTLVSRDAALLDAAATAIRGRCQVAVRTIAADLSRHEEVERVAREAGEIDILVNNAGAIPPGTLTGVENETWRRAWDLKVFGYISLCRAIYPSMAVLPASISIPTTSPAAPAMPR